MLQIRHKTSVKALNIFHIVRLTPDTAMGRLAGQDFRRVRSALKDVLKVGLEKQAVTKLSIEDMQFSMNSTDLPPQAVLMQMLNGKTISYCISVAADIGVADVLHERLMSADEIAEKLNVHADALYRILRLLARTGVFEERADRIFANTSLSESLRRDVPGSVRNAARWFGSELIWGACGKLGHTVRTGENGLQALFPGKSSFETIFEHHEFSLFNDAMTSWTTIESQAILHSYDFNRFTHLVDIGGGHGGLALAIAQATEKTKLTVHDQPNVLPGAQAAIAAQRLTERVHTEAGDFFQAVPGPADGYIMKHIIHDWNDDECVSILSNCRDQLMDGGQILVCEQVVTSGPEAMPALCLDITMLYCTTGRERTKAEYETLFEKSGLKLQRIVTTSEPICIIEAAKA